MSANNIYASAVYRQLPGSVRAMDPVIKDGRVYISPSLARYRNEPDSSIFVRDLSNKHSCVIVKDRLWPKVNNSVVGNVKLFETAMIDTVNHNLDALIDHHGEALMLPYKPDMIEASLCPDAVAKFALQLPYSAFAAKLFLPISYKYWFVDERAHAGLPDAVLAAVRQCRSMIKEDVKLSIFQNLPDILVNIFDSETHGFRFHTNM